MYYVLICLQIVLSMCVCRLCGDIIFINLDKKILKYVITLVRELVCELRASRTRYARPLDMLS